MYKQPLICPKCQNTLPDDSQFCKYCGEKIQIPVALDVSCENQDPQKPPTLIKKILSAPRKYIVYSIVVLIFIILLPTVIVPNIKYKNACSKLENSSYYSAIDIFEDLGEFKDSKDKIIEAKYQLGSSQLDDGDYESAIQIFEELDGFKDSEERISEAKYKYVLANKNNEDPKTFSYLSQLKDQNYKDSSTLYSSLYDWEIILIGINSNEKNTYHQTLTSISKYDPVIFHVKLSGGTPNAKTRVIMRSTWPDGSTKELISDTKVNYGTTLHFGWNKGLYANPQTGATGTLHCKFYDENENLIGIASVKITD